MTRDEFRQIAKSFNLSIHESIFGPQAYLNDDIVAALWVVNIKSSKQSYATVFEPKRRDITKLETLSKYLPLAIKSLKEKQVLIKLQQINQDFK
jgi:hypothetical protein